MDVETKYILVLLCTCFTLVQAINGKIFKMYKVTDLLLFGTEMPFFILKNFFQNIQKVKFK